MVTCRVLALAWCLEDSGPLMWHHFIALKSTHNFHALCHRKSRMPWCLPDRRISCVSRMLQVSPMCWRSKGKPFNTCFFDPCFSWTAALHTLAQKPPIFRSLSDTISWEIASEKHQIKKCESAGSEDSSEQQKFAWNPHLTTCQSHNPFWKDSNKTPEFKAKQHLGLILEALILGHIYPWPWSHLSFATMFFSSSASSFHHPWSMPEKTNPSESWFSHLLNTALQTLPNATQEESSQRFDFRHGDSQQKVAM